MPDLKSFAMQKESISNNAIITNYNNGKIITSSDLKQLDQLYNDNQEYIIILMKRKHNNSQMPEWFKTWNDEVYEKKQPQWFKTWTEEVYEKKPPQWFNKWNKDVFEKVVRLNNLKTK